MNILKLAWRNVWRNSRRSGVTIAAMTIALVVELLYGGLVNGLVIGMEEDAVSIDMGDIQIFAPKYETRPSLYEAVPDPDKIVTELESRGFHASPRLFAGGLAASGDASAGVAFVGVDPVKDATVLELNQYVGKGQWLSDDDPRGVVIGRSLARTLGADIGSEIVVLSQAADGSMANDLFTVRGILMTVAASMDRSTILMTEGTFRQLMAFPEGAHKIIVRRPLGTDLTAATDIVRSVVGLPEGKVMAEQERAARMGEAPMPAYPVIVRDWKSLNPFLAQYLESVSSVVVIVFLIVYMAVAILILNAMLMAVFERIREFGVLKAIGYGPGQVLSMMVLEGMMQAVVACVLGVVIAAPGMWYMQTHGIDVGALGGMQMVGLTMPAIWKSYYSVDSAVTPVILLFFIVFGAVIYPAMKAAFISPIEAMHHQ